MRIIIDKKLKENFVDIKRLVDRIISLKLISGKKILNIISVYVPQVAIEEHIKKECLENMDATNQGISVGEKLIIGGDLNDHIGRNNKNYERVHGGFRYGVRKEGGEKISDFTSSYDLVIPNTSSKKRDEDLITYKSRLNSTQIEFFLN